MLITMELVRNWRQLFTVFSSLDWLGHPGNSSIARIGKIMTVMSYGELTNPVEEIVFFSKKQPNHMVSDISWTFTKVSFFLL